MEKNITTLLQEIKSETGWSEPRIAQLIGTSQPTVNRILKGQGDCKGRTLQAIQKLYKKVCVEAISKINKADQRTTGKKSP